MIETAHVDQHDISTDQSMRMKEHQGREKNS
jgi:hypothetical protein